MANYTEHYQLHQWEPEDPFLRTDFNEDLEKIDTALGAIPRIVSGAYIGDGAASRTIKLDFTHRMVYVCSDYGTVFDTSPYHVNYHGGLALQDYPAQARDVAYLSIVTNGFRVIHQEIISSGSDYITYYGTNTNQSGYRYFAVG